MAPGLQVPHIESAFPAALRYLQDMRTKHVRATQAAEKSSLHPWSLRPTRIAFVQVSTNVGMAALLQAGREHSCGLV